MVEPLVKAFLDIIVMSMLNGNPRHGYRIIADLHRTFGVLLSPGTLYPLLYRLKDEKLLEVQKVKRKKLYKLTPQGQKKIVITIEQYRASSEKIFNCIDNNLETLILAT